MYQQISRMFCWTLLVLTATQSVSAQNVGSRAKFGTWNPAAGQPTGYYGILGEINRPGVYSAEGREVSLQEIVQQAGGLTAQAGPTIRLIRQQRVTQGKFFDPNGRDLLQSGDLLLVDSRSPVAANSPVTYIGILGVANHPVIVPLQPENAQLQRLMLALGQSPELARTARLMMPSRQPLPNSPTALLPSGTVLALDPRLLVSANLPAFPDPIAMAFAPAPAQGGLPTADASLTMPQQPPALAASSGVVIPDSRLPVLPAGRNGNQIDATPLPFTNGDSRPQVNDASLPVPGSRLSPLPVQPVRPETKPKAAVPLVNSDAEIVPDLDDADLDLEDEEPSITATNPSAGFSPWQMLGIVGTVASLVGLAVLSRTMMGPTATRTAKAPVDDDIVPASIRKRSSMPTAEVRRPHRRFDFPESTPAAPSAPTIARVAQSPAVPAPAQEPLDLPAVLSMRGPIETEEVILPRGLKLRQAMPVATPMYRVDEAAALPGAPHERPTTPMTPQRMLDTPIQEKIPAPHFRAAPMPAARSTEAEMAAAPVGGTAIERALHQLQQGKLS